MKSIVTSCLNQRFQELALKADCPFVLAQVSDGQYLVSKTCDAFDLTVMPKPGKSAEAIIADSDIYASEQIEAKLQDANLSDNDRGELMRQLKSELDT